MKITLINDLVLIKRAEGATKVGLIELAPTSVEELQEGTVIAVGPGKPYEIQVRDGPDGTLLRTERRHWERRPMSVAVGDRVVFSERGHQVVKIEGNFFVTLREDSIVGVIPEPDEVPILVEPVPDETPDDTDALDEDELSDDAPAGAKLRMEFAQS
jgi:co-chaperonin GroES (HSP10)